MNNSEENVHKSENFTENSGIQRVIRRLNPPFSCLLIELH